MSGPAGGGYPCFDCGNESTVTKQDEIGCDYQACEKCGEGFYNPVQSSAHSREYRRIKGLPPLVPRRRASPVPPVPLAAARQEKLLKILAMHQDDRTSGRVAAEDIEALFAADAERSEAVKERLTPIVAKIVAYGVEQLARKNDPTGDRFDSLLDEIIEAAVPRPGPGGTE